MNVEATGAPIAAGAFSGLSDHVTVGGVAIHKDDEGYVVVLGEDFSLDGAPDPVLGFGDGSYVAASKFSSLRNKDGKQSYRLPAEIDPTGFTQIYVWCEQFSVPLGVATLG